MLFYNQSELIELRLVESSRSIDHNIASSIILRECDTVADRVKLSEQRDKTVETVCKATVRRRTELERSHQETELLLSLLRRETKKLEHLMLKLALMDTDRTAADLNAIDHHIVGISADCTRIRVKQRNILRLRRSERMMHSIETLVLLAPLKERKIDNPKTRVLILRTETKLITHLKTKLTELLAGLVGVVAGENQDKIARLSRHGSLQLLKHLLRIELINRRLHIAVSFHAGVDHTLGSDLRLLDEISKLVKLLAGINSGTLGADTADIFSVIEYRETMALEHIHKLDKTHVETSIRLIRAIILHSIMPSHARKHRKVNALDLLEKMASHALKHLEDILLLNERHLTVDLSELRLTVGTEILIAETLHDLEITVETAHHKQLLESLRRLRQSIELPLIHAAWNDKVARALRSRLDEHRSLHLKETLRVEIAANLESHAVAKLKIPADTLTAEVKVTVLHTDVIATVRLILDSERRSDRRVEHHKTAHDNLDVAGRNLGILRAALSHCSLNLDDKFTSDMVSLLAEVSVNLIIEHKLSDAVAVAEIDKSHTSHFAGTLHPTGQRNLLVKIGDTKLATSMRSIHIYNVFILTKEQSKTTCENLTCKITKKIPFTTKKISTFAKNIPQQ